MVLSTVAAVALSFFWFSHLFGSGYSWFDRRLATVSFKARHYTCGNTGLVVCGKIQNYNKQMVGGVRSLNPNGTYVGPE